MTYRQIYLAALRMLSENEVDGDVEDYEDRAGYLLATFCAQAAPADLLFRTERGMETPVLTLSGCVELDETFPLCDPFVPPAEYFLASMLAIDENEELSDRLFERYTDAMASIEDSLPARPLSISDRYGLIY